MTAPTRLLLRSSLIAALLGMVLTAQMASAAGHHGKAAIQLGGVFVQLGDPSAVSLPILNGYKLAFTQANASGGINGAQINYSVRDDNYNPQDTKPAVQDLVENQHVLAIAGIFGSDDSNAAIPYLQQQKVPFFDPIGGGAAVSGDSWIWQTEPSYALEGQIIGHYLKKTMKIKKIAVVYQQGVNEPEITTLQKWYSGSNFFDVSYQADATDATISNLVSLVKSHNPDVIVLLGTLIPTADFVKTASATGYQPPKGYFANYPQGDPTWLGLTAGCSCMNGSHVSSYADLTGKNPVAKAYAAAIKKYDPSQTNTNYGLYGYFNGSLMIRALKLASKAAKSGTITATGLQKILNTDFRSYKSGFTGVLNWTSKYRYGVKQFKIYKISGSKFIPVTSWLNS